MERASEQLLEQADEILFALVHDKALAEGNHNIPLDSRNGVGIYDPVRGGCAGERHEGTADSLLSHDQAGRMAVDFCHNIWRDAAGGEALVLKLADCGQVLGKDHGLFLQIGNGNTGKTSLRILEWECLGMAFWNGKNQFLCLEQHAFKRKRRISGQSGDHF